MGAFEGGGIAGELTGRGGAAAAALGTGVAAGDGTSAAGLGGSTGVSSTVECLPVVQGGMARNSSKVRTRGLQHFQPAG